MIETLRPGIHRWTARHPDWHPADAFGAEVASYALTGDATGTLLLIDPLLPDDAPDLLDDLARDARGGVAIFITIGYHVRSTAALVERYDATAYGPEPARRRDPRRPAARRRAARGRDRARDRPPAPLRAAAVASRRTARSPSATRSSRRPRASCGCGARTPSRRSASGSTPSASRPRCSR